MSENRRTPQNNRNINRQSNNRKPPNNSRAKKKQIGRTFSIFMSLLTVIFFIRLTGNIYSMSTRQTAEIMALEKIDVKKSDFYSGIIIRDEYVYKSGRKGYLSYNAREEDKVKPGELIFEISDKEVIDNLSQELDIVNENLFSLQNFRKEYSIYKSDIDNIEIENKNNIEKWSMKSYKDIYDLSNFLNDNIDVRNQIIFSDSRIIDNGKIETKGIIEDKIDTNTLRNYANAGGIVSYSIDGMEETFTFENMGNITKKQTEMKPDEKKSHEIIVSEDTDVMRIVESNIWYIASYIPIEDDEVGNLNAGSRKRIYIEDNGSIKEIESIIHSITDSGEDKFVIFELKKNMIDFIDDRNINITLKSETFESFKIPTTAVIDKDMIKIPEEYVIKTDKDVVIRKTEIGDTATIPINIDTRDEAGGFVYLSRDINNLKIGDILVGVGEEVKTYEIRNYETIKGVYKVNNGISNFVRIKENENVTSTNAEEYIYILPTKTLKEYDRIITNAQEIEENEIVQ